MGAPANVFLWLETGPINIDSNVHHFNADAASWRDLTTLHRVLSKIRFVSCKFLNEKRSRICTFTADISESNQV